MTITPTEDLSGPLPLGPDSLTWSLFGDRRVTLLTLWAGTLQAMHPTIDAALVEHSTVFDNEIARLVQSGEVITNSVYEDGNSVAITIRGYHTELSGVRPDGQAYHALNPDAYFWAHATFFMAPIVAAEYFGTPMTEDQKHILYRESKTWYARYGVSQRIVPKDYDDFLVYWEATIRDDLVYGEALERSTMINGRWHEPPFPNISPRLWKLIYPVLVRVFPFVARGTMPAVARERAGWSWSRRDERILRTFAAVVRTIFRVVPKRRRLVPAAAAAVARGITPTV